MNLDTKFSKDFEVKRVKKTLGKMSWYKEQGYRPWLPEGIDQDSSEQEIKTKISEEYQEKEYEKVTTGLSNSFDQISNQFENALQELFVDVPNVITVNITKYGVGGSYNVPSTIVLNFHMSNLLNTVIHEIVHLVVEPYIQKYKIDHWEKERIVDLILHSDKFSFLNYDFWQRDYHGAEEKVDELFKKTFFENSEEFFKSLKSIK